MRRISNPGELFSDLNLAISDLFPGYNDNFITSDFRPGFRSIYLKVTYWLNI